MNVLMGVVFIAGGIVLIMDRFYSDAIEDQRSRNQYLGQKISVLEERIEEIQGLQQKRNQLLSRMQVIQELQGNRPIIVRLFDEIAKRLADRVFYTRMSVKGKSLGIDGIAESNNRVSSQLRNFNDSQWFEKPNVSGILADVNFGPQASQFHLSVQQTTPKKEQEN
jgi:type IV pilus assembly protein PilN